MFDEAKIRQAIEKVSITELELSVQEASEVAFHMTDWLNNLEALVKFYQTPEALNLKEINQLLMSFLIHVPNHLAAAAKIYADYPVKDIFGVSAVGKKGSDSV